MDVLAPAEAPPDLLVIDAGDHLVMPGVVDSHVHVNEPGRTEWEGFTTATRAAVAGGVTTLVDMPLNSIPATTSVAALEAKREAARGRVRVDVGFWGGVVPGNSGELAALHEAGVLGFKAFLAPSGVDEFPHVGEAELRPAMRELARLGAVLLVHAEDPSVLDRAEPVWKAPGASDRSYRTYLASRPPEAETAAIELVLRLCRELGTRVHVVHLATGAALPALAAARAEGLPVTVETCPHYLTFAAEEIADGATAWKCAPPIREAAEREALWRALGRGEIDLVASDHSPAPPALKGLDSGDFRRAWGGIASLQLALPAVWTAARERGHRPEALVPWMCTGPARLAGLVGRKGAIAPGYDADLVVWDPEASFEVRPEDLHHRHPVTPYAGRTLFGRVVRTFVRGVEVFRDGEIVGDPAGELLRR